MFIQREVSQRSSQCALAHSATDSPSSKHFIKAQSHTLRHRHIVSSTDVLCSPANPLYGGILGGGLVVALGLVSGTGFHLCAEPCTTQGGLLQLVKRQFIEAPFREWARFVEARFKDGAASV